MGSSPISGASRTILHLFLYSTTALFNKLNFLSDNQFGFRKNHSTFRALIFKIVDKIERAMVTTLVTFILTLVRDLTQ